MTMSIHHSSSQRHLSRGDFPDDFTWGVATSTSRSDSSADWRPVVRGSTVVTT